MMENKKDSNEMDVDEWCKREFYFYSSSNELLCLSILFKVPIAFSEENECPRALLDPVKPSKTLSFLPKKESFSLLCKKKTLQISL